MDFIEEPNQKAIHKQQWPVITALHVHLINTMKGLISLKSHVSTSTVYSPVYE